MKEKNVTPRDIAALALKRLKARADPGRAAAGQKYFKEPVALYGLASLEVRDLLAELFASVKGKWTVREAIELCDILFPEPELEPKAIAGLILANFKKDFPASLFTKIKGWLGRNYLDNWASVDVFCPEAVGALLVRYPKLIKEIKTWARHPNRWVKRASAVSFIKLARKGEFLPDVYEIAESLFPVEDDLIHKANGWLLREAGKKDMEKLEAFLLRHGPAIPRTTLRYAIERFPPARRKELLQATR